MRIQRLEIKNFRGLKDYVVEFAPETTVLIGRNGAGKSTLIDAVAMAVSFVFSSNRILGADFLSAGNKSLNIKSFGDNDYHYDSASGTTSADASIKATGTYNGKKLEWELYKRSTSNAALFASKYKDAFVKFTTQWKQHGADLPVIAYFSDSFPHKDTKQTPFAMRSIKKDRIPRNFGYYQWDLSTACTSIWEIRLSNILARLLPSYTKMMRIASEMHGLESHLTHDQLKSDTRYNELQGERDNLQKYYGPLIDEYEYIFKRLNRFSRMLPRLEQDEYYITDFTTQNTEKGTELMFVFKNGMVKSLSDLPAGYRRLYSIVMDIAYRAYILNGDKEPSGIVLIDEVDLHLHPSLEQEVASSLREIFPNIQFIMTTHSAAVVANLDTVAKADAPHSAAGAAPKRNRLLWMADGQTRATQLDGVYGLDYNAAVRDFMDTPSSNAEIRRLGDLYLFYLSSALETEATTVYSKLTGILGSENHPYLLELKEKGRAYAVH